METFVVHEFPCDMCRIANKVVNCSKKQFVGKLYAMFNLKVGGQMS